MSNNATYLRMLGYTLTISLHMGNMIFLSMAMKQETGDDPELNEFGNLQTRYFTCWTFFLQIVHGFVGLTCDYLTLVHSKEKAYKLPKHLKRFRDTLFGAILWPSSWVVFSVFWSLFLYDRKLIFPEFADKVITKTSNHIMHTVVIFVVLWEVCFQPRLIPKSHRWNLLHLMFHLALYVSVLIYTYIERGIWLYPIFAILYGTAYFPFIYIAIGVIALSFYYIQWPLTNYLWTHRQTIKKIR